ncbi:MAG: hypothetical protein HY062_12975 [Bacteroidetes bacterium]|nr:hypothetical protein [Bacteroidota bacterium]
MKYLLLIFFCTLLSSGFSQKILEIDITHFNHFKSVQLFNDSYLEYKLKGEHRYRINKMVNMKDSLIIFSNDSSIALGDIKRIKLRDANHLYRLFSRFFYTGGVLFVSLDTFNNLINNDTPYIKQTAVIASAGLITMGFLIHQLSIKRITINKHHSLRILETDYQHLNK